MRNVRKGRADACKRQVTRDHRPLCVITSSIRSGAWYLIGLKCTPTLPFSLLLSLLPSFFHFPFHAPPLFVHFSSRIPLSLSLPLGHLSLPSTWNVRWWNEHGPRKAARSRTRCSERRGRIEILVRSGMPKYLTEKMISPHLDSSHCLGTARYTRRGWIRFFVEPEPFPPLSFEILVPRFRKPAPRSLLLVSSRREEGRFHDSFLRPFPVKVTERGE